MKKIRITILLLLLTGLIGFTGYVKYPEEVVRYYKVAINELKALKLSLFPYEDEYFTYITGNEAMEILGWLNSGQFDNLDQHFRSLTLQYKNDIKYEHRLHDSYNVFKRVSELNPDRFDEWVNLNTNNTFALTSRAYYFVAKAWDERGRKYISETPQENIESMRHYMKKSETDINKRISLDDSSALPYVVLVHIAAATGQHSDRIKYFQKGINIMPGSYILRDHYMSFLEPKWGVPTAEKKKFVEKQMEYLQHNPGVIRLKAKYYYTKAITYDETRSNTKILLLEKSLELDRYWKSLTMLGYLYKSQNKYGQSIDILTESISRRPDYYWSLVWRGGAYTGSKDYKLAENDFKNAIKLYPKRFNAYILYLDVLTLTGRYNEALLLNQKVQKIIPSEMEHWLTNRGETYFAMKQYKNALDNFKAVIEIDDNNAWVWTHIGIIYQHHIKNLQLATAAHRKALEIKSTHQRFYNYAATLYMSKDPEAPTVFAAYISSCKSHTCDKASEAWSKRFMACVNRRKSCDFEKHDYQNWL